MNKLEVLCTTMHQKDFSKLKEMNIQSNIVFANQADRYAYEEIEYNGHIAKMVTTAQRGVGKNRNTALLYASGDICLLADDDVCYVDGYPQAIINAFNKVSNADIMIFNLITQSQRKQRQNKSIKRVWSPMGYGAPRIAFKLYKVKKANIWFHQLFGGGCKYPSGEDSLWLLDALRKGLKIYTYPLIIGEIRQETSTWFKGFNEEFFFGKGAALKAGYPKSCYLRMLYFMFRTKNLTSLPVSQRMKFMLSGMRDFSAETINGDENI
jgi:glycosyltransferase involved in cell wall biosynthesis